jgi:cyclic-di-AMP phosphodiesterase PgpH
MDSDETHGKTFNLIYRGILFLITSAILIYLFPREGKFQYEYQKGKPWMHDLLVAPFDFPVYKPEKELSADQDSVLKDFRPYYSIDTTIWLNESKKFKDEIKKKWFSLDKKSLGSLVDSALRDEFEIYRLCILKELQALYAKGLSSDADAIKEQGEPTGIEILHNNYAATLLAKEVLTPRTAYEILVRNVTNGIQDTLNYTREHIHAILANLDLNDYLYSNLKFERFKSAQARKTILSEVSTTRGMIREGEKIVFKGELVNDSSYRVIESLRKEYEKRLGLSSFQVMIGQSILVMISVLVVFLFLGSFRKEVYQNRIRTLFILLLIVLMAFAARMTIEYSVFSIYVIPIALVPIIIKTFYDSRLALFVHMITILIIGFWVPNGFEFVFLSFVAGIIAIFTLSNNYRRGKLFLSAVLVVLTYCVVYFGICIIQEGKINKIDWIKFLWFAANGLLVLSSYPLIYIFERVFGFLSDATLIELSDTNQPLLRKLAELAPGTFQHSLQVSNLAEEVIIKIGGSPLLVRAGALYHDIGKMENPHYFIENQAPGINYHDKLKFVESAEIIIGHTTKGVEIARKNDLPEQIIDFIRTHHGTSTVQYFYRSYLKQNPEPGTEISRFRYPGPKPVSKEEAVLMMADSVEAASRSLREVNEAALADLVEYIINHQIADDQFSEANITFSDIREIKSIFKKKLQTIYHLRIEYPR